MERVAWGGDDMEVGTAGYFAVVEPQVNLRVQVVSPPKLPARINEILTGSSHKRDPSDPGACLVSNGVSHQKISRSFRFNFTSVGCRGINRKSSRDRPE